jgi:hypothetical protein
MMIPDPPDPFAHPFIQECEALGSLVRTFREELVRGIAEATELRRRIRRQVTLPCPADLGELWADEARADLSVEDQHMTIIIRHLEALAEEAAHLDRAVLAAMFPEAESCTGLRVIAGGKPPKLDPERPDFTRDLNDT